GLIDHGSPSGFYHHSTKKDLKWIFIKSSIALIQKKLKIIYLQKSFGVFVAIHSVFLWQFVRCFCGGGA
ncbi:hypothetical protein, partial [Porphyromonas sp. HMSC077F02]|uniref:hypothetical protein n=1 Tax=Porphyromonas sp. HMSC077F02 TaxID=1739529 RepID=UPI001AEF725C